MAAITKEMVAEAIANETSLTDAAAAWKVKKSSLSTRIKKQNWGINGTWPEIRVQRANRARDAMTSVDIFSNRTYDSVAKELGVSKSTIAKKAKDLSGGAPVVNRHNSQEYHDHIAQLEQQLNDGSVRRVCVSVALPPGRSVDPVPVGRSVMLLNCRVISAVRADRGGVAQARTDGGCNRSALGGVVLWT